MRRRSSLRPQRDVSRRTRCAQASSSNPLLIAHVTVPLLFIAGMKDEIVPPAQMRLLELAAVASPAVEMHKVAEGMHNDTWMKAGPQLVHWLDEFIQKAGRGPTSRAS